MRNEDEARLRNFCAARDRGDADEMQLWWGLLVESNVDRVMNIAATAGPRQLTREEREDAAQAAFIKVWQNMLHTFRGNSIGAFYAALVQCVKFALLDEHRAGAIAMARSRSVDEAASDAEHDGYDAWTSPEARQRFERDLEKREAADFLAWALPRMTKERHRLVIERTLDGVPVADVAAELDTSENNVHAMRSRGLKELRRLLNDYEDQDA